MYSSYGMAYKIAGVSNLSRKLEIIHNALYNERDPERIFNTFLHYSYRTEVNSLAVEFVYPTAFKDYPIKDRYPIKDLIINYEDLNLDHYIYEMNLPRTTTSALINLYDTAASDMDKFLVLMLYFIVKTTYI